MPVQTTAQTRYIVQSYVLDRRMQPRPSLALTFESRNAAELRAQRMMVEANISGVHVICQSCTPEFDEYDEPVVMLSLGQVPEI